ncbi:MAG: quinolinate synthase [Actinobacteria bacterium HGW-Actinobacteria-10]|jgi:quinolinate synthase|nr:MAG: quinolinate synthase [Actinobacteria bacterium HGW-Actinobacteria-10]
MAQEIRALVREHNAVLLAHNYQRAEVQEVADFVGDSLGLSRQAAATDAEWIVFAGVHFMAETAKLLSPGKRVSMPEPRAGCPMADMMDAADLAKWRDDNPGIPVVTYVNSTAAVKALTDVCVTSANAVAVVRSLGAPKVLFGPDRNLAWWVARSLPDVEVIPWSGYCPTHEQVTAQAVLEAKSRHSSAKVMVHPECRPEVIELADAVLSTSQMLSYAADSPAQEFIVVTEEGLIHALSKAAPGKRFVGLESRMLCPNMKLTTLEKVRDCLRDGTGDIEIDPQIAAAARGAVERMVRIG